MSCVTSLVSSGVLLGGVLLGEDVMSLSNVMVCSLPKPTVLLGPSC